MKFLDAQKRKFIHINSGIKTIPLIIDSEEYMALDLKGQMDFIKELLPIVEDGHAILIKVELQEKENFVLDDEQLSTIFSNMVVSFSNQFEEQKFKVLTPKESFLENFPATPISMMTALMLRIVKKPFQIEIVRNYNFGEDQEIVRLVV